MYIDSNLCNIVTEINYPDSAGIACDVQQHALHLPCYYFRGNVYHPNYYLGCDTTCGPCLTTGLPNPSQGGAFDFRFTVIPNPNNGVFKIIYLVPQNKSGLFEVFDVHGRKIHEQGLPQWSSLQYFYLGMLDDGVYNCVITSDGNRAFKNVAVIK